MNSRTISHGPSTLTIDLLEIKRNCKKFAVTLRSGIWPSDYDLITLVDGGDPAFSWDEQLHNGGQIELGEQKEHRTVTVFNK